MDAATTVRIVCAVLAVVVGGVYFMRRRSRLNKED